MNASVAGVEKISPSGDKRYAGPIAPCAKFEMICIENSVGVLTTPAGTVRVKFPSGDASDPPAVSIVAVLATPTGTPIAVALGVG